MRRWHRPLLLLAAAMAALVVVSLGGMVSDRRVVTGLPIWDKSLKFALSVLIYSLTWAWLLDQISVWRRVAWWAATTAALGLGVEMIVIVTQIIRGTTSHFNRTTGLNSELFNTMGASIAAAWLATLVVCAIVFVNPSPDPARTVAIRSGAVVSVIGAALGLLMVPATPNQRDTHSLIRGAHTVGLPDGGPGLPILGWSTAGGDLRVPHFVGMHALQILPLIVIAMEMLAPRVRQLRSARTRSTLIAIAAAAYAAMLTVLTWQALRGQSVVRPDGLTLLAVAGVLAMATLASGVVIGRTRAATGLNAPAGPRGAGGVRR
jgi:hypothetical protein